MATQFELVEMFHEKFDLKYDNGPRNLDREELNFRLVCHKEEQSEFELAIYELCVLLDSGKHENDPLVIEARAEVLDALIDSSYFIIGTCYRMGFDYNKAFEIVHKANMNKQLPLPGEETKRNWHKEVVKPVGWAPPELKSLTVSQEWPDDNVSSVRGLITLDGVDCSGKTTLANTFVELYGAEYIHLTWSPELEKVMDEYRLSAIKYAIALSRTKLVILDRPWLSQVIYAEIFRGGTKWPHLARACDKLLMGAHALQIMCLFSTTEEATRAFKESEKKEKELYRHMRNTSAAFNAVYYGNSIDFNPASSEYVLNIVKRQGGLRERGDVIKYERNLNGHDLKAFAKRVVSKIIL